MAAPQEIRQHLLPEKWGIGSHGDAELGNAAGPGGGGQVLPAVTGRKPSAWWPGGREVGAAAGSRGLPPSRAPVVEAVGASPRRREPLRSVKPQSLYMAPAWGCSEGRW